MVYVFDLDGTLCHTTGRSYELAIPIPARIAQVNALFDRGHLIIIDTARGSETGFDWRALTERQLASWGVHYTTLYVGTKIYGDVYVDDHAIADVDFFGERHALADKV